MSIHQTKVIPQNEGPTTLEVPQGFSAFVFTADGDLDIALLPREDHLDRDEDDEPVANEGMMRIMGIIMALEDPDVQALIHKKTMERPQS